MKEKLKIAIIGLGLIGGSIFKSLDKRKYDIFAISKSQKGKNIFKDYSMLKDRDLIFVCSNMSDTLDILDKLDKILNPKTIVCDVSSVKSFLNKKYSFNFISTHPMAGTEKSGYKASFKGLFKGAYWVIKKDNKILRKIIKDLGAKVLIAENDKQDMACAMISHLPTLISYALMDITEDDTLSQKLASSGFRDMTRLSMGNSILISDMLKYNEKNIDIALDKIQNSLNKIKNLSYNERVKLFDNLSLRRKKMYKNGKNQSN